MNSPVVQSEFGLFDPATDSRTRDAYAVEEARLAAEKSGQCYTGPLWQAPPSSAAVPPPEDGPPLIELYRPVGDRCLRTAARRGAGGGSSPLPRKSLRHRRTAGLRKVPRAHRSRAGRSHR